MYEESCFAEPDLTPWERERIDRMAVLYAACPDGYYEEDEF